MRQAPTARLFIGTGLYDSLTTVGAAEHLLRHSDIPLGRAEHHRHPAGHMMYTDPAACQKSMTGLRGFLSSGSATDGAPT
jgi:hypothetical protein